VNNYNRGNKLSLVIKGNGVVFLKYTQVQP